MDVLSDVITTMRGGRPRASLVAWRAPWAQEFGPVPGAAGFQIVRKGPCWLLRSSAAPVRIGVGEVIFRPHGSGHVLAGEPAPSVIAPACDPRDVPRIVGGPTDVDGAATVTLCGAYELDPGRTHPLVQSLPELIRLPASEVWEPTVAQLASELERPRLGTDALVPALLDTLLLHILRVWLADQPAAPGGSGWAAALNDPVTATALDAMHREPGRPWTVAGLAAEAGLSRAPFARRFTAALGRPPLDYLTWWRMSVAARRLRETDAPLSAIAAEVGYGSEFAFAAAFKRRFGVAPGRFRRVS